MRPAVPVLVSLAVVALLFLPALPGASAPAAALPAPTFERPYVAPTSPAPALAAGAPGAAPAAAGPSATPATAGASAAGPSSGLCDTPMGIPIWSVPNFFVDAVVTFSIPGGPNEPNSGFQTVPCNNVIPTYTNGFWMNVSTNVALTTANVTIWGTGWPGPGAPSPDIPNFGPATPQVMPMTLNGPYYHTASFFFNVYRFFWPGSQVFFNITLQTVQASPGTIWSTESNISEPVPFPGGTNNATWGFYVADPWGTGQSAASDANFSQDIQVTTTPSVLSEPSYEPNPHQSLQITLTAVNPLGGAAHPIPMAEGEFTLSGAETGVYYQYFGPINHTVVQLDAPLGPYPGTRIQFNITAWLPWAQSATGLPGAIDRIYSPYYAFNWSSNGGWWQPTGGLAPNLNLHSNPDNVTNLSAAALTPSGMAILETGTPVNVSIHSPIQNVTIGSASVTYHVGSASGFVNGRGTMHPATQNTSYLVLPGLPPGSTLTFSVTAQDVFGNTISSGNYTYREDGPANLTLPASYGLFFAEAVDLSTGQLIPRVNYTITNDTWSETGAGSAYGFAAPVPLGGVGYLPLAFGSYTVTLRAFGTSQTITFDVADATPFTVVFYFASQPLAPTTSVNAPSVITLPAVIGLVATIPVAWFVMGWFRERRRKAEAEQRRISL